ncbi:Serine--tRNA ligase [Candidatus Erwinia haradaeae]|uniref:Serine--tRNA ligase n=1 Tax=Candidatus Erwinia haradaeae TaxID=1922217 RepID=A0A451DCH8_9GAMM|nr:serine--tRNA ligase [Candidatus Erwinia haradaeae]VFP84088.1 Serine--tRNA ligase [Candidatus Erwinia haradaeae]
MIDIHLLRSIPEIISTKLARRGYHLDITTLHAYEEKRKILQIETESIQAQRKIKSKFIGQAKQRGETTELLCQEVKILSKQLDVVKKELSVVLTNIHTILVTIPNIPDDIIPIGKDSSDNQELYRWGQPKKFDFPVKDHVVLGQQMEGLDFDTAVKITGSRFVVMRGHIALMYRALGQFMLNLHTEQHGYQETYVPYLVNNTSLYGTGHLPKFSQDLCYLNPSDAINSNINYALIPTAEVSLTNIIRNKIIEEDSLPLKMVAKTPCFRSEAGSYGRDTRGLIRMHQFDKVEMVQITRQKDSMNALEELVGHAEKVLQLLQLPYRHVLLCTGDLSFSAQKTYDLEVWLPAQNTYREISSCSNMGDFQSRRMQARWRVNGQKKTHFVHTINGSGLAIGRTLVAILENYQEKDGRVRVPEILRPYMNNIDYIGQI